MMMHNTKAIKSGAGDYDEQLARLVSMGFHPVNAEEALEATNGDMDQALSYLLSGKTAVGEDDMKEDTKIIAMTKTYVDSVGQKQKSRAHEVPWKNRNEFYDEELSSPKKPRKEDEVPTMATTNGTSTLATSFSASPSPTVGFRRRSEPPRRQPQPGAEAVDGTLSLPPSFPSINPPGRDDETPLVSAELVSQDPRAPAGPLVLASPLTTNDNDGGGVTRRELRRCYMIGCAAIILLAAGIAVALLFVLGRNNDDSAPAPLAPNVQATGPPTVAPNDDGSQASSPTAANLPSFAPAAASSPTPSFSPTVAPFAPDASSPSTTTREPTVINAPVPTNEAPFPSATPAPVTLPTTMPPTSTPPTTIPPTPFPTPAPVTVAEPPPTSSPTPAPTTRPPSTQPPTPFPTPAPTSKPPTTEPPTLFPTPSPTRPPTPFPSVPPCSEKVERVIRSASLNPSALDGSSSERRALDWITSQQDCDSGVAEWLWIQAYALAVVYYSTNGGSWFSDSNWLSSSSNVCNPEWDHVNCNGNAATEFLPDNDGLSGTIPGKYLCDCK